ncbi:hypothetical protein [Algoriphagus yeomjeoni]|nr:hypothetical protein [Algoriphagus yeomjeoni]
MRYHMLPKSKAPFDSSSGERTEIVDVAGIHTRIFILPGEISGCREHLREVSRGHSSQQDLSFVNTKEFSRVDKGPNVL